MIGLAWSDDLHHWKRTKPILRPEDGAAWERGGLRYKPYLVKIGRYLLHLFYANAKNDVERGWTRTDGAGDIEGREDLDTASRGIRFSTAGGPDSWDARFASDPAVVRYRGEVVGSLPYYGLAANGRAREAPLR